MRFWEAAPLITYTTAVILGSNFRYQNQKINYRLLIKCERDDIAWKISKKNVTMKENKIQNFYIEYNGAWIENHLHAGADCNLGPTWEQNSCAQREKYFLFQGQLEMFPGRSVLGLTSYVPGSIYSSNSASKCRSHIFEGYTDSRSQFWSLFLSNNKRLL